MFTYYNEPKVIKKLLTDEDCDFLINHKNETLERTTFNNYDDLSGIKSLFKRVSKKEDILKKLIEKCIKLNNFSYDNFEDLVVMNYKPGGFISEHLDPSKDSSNIRTHTILMYLNDEYEGGETFFTRINKEFRLEKGDAIFFSNIDSNGNMTSLSLHEGKVVKSGEKWVCNLWVRKYPLTI